MRIVLLVFLVICFEFATGEIKPGSDQPEKYLPFLEGKRVGLVVNHTSMVGEEHLLDFLLSKGVNVMRVFAPEHGFRGKADAGETITDGKDAETGVQIVSLYGNNKKPRTEQLKGLDVVIFDIQDVGVRFYTYISTMHYVMEACAENDKPLVIFDRPNPNGDYVAGPVLDLKFRSFVGMHPIPVVHGCTVGELALMINSEGWLKDRIKCNLSVVPVANYNHNTPYSLPVKPSPNLPSDRAIRLYPSLCFFEASSASVGRGTQFPFQVIGYPDKRFGDFEFTPRSIDGMAKNPKQEGVACYGIDLRNSSFHMRFTLSYFLEFYHKFDNESDFLTRERWFNLLAGTDKLIEEIRASKSCQEIEASWKRELNEYLAIRKNYLLYPDFE